MLEARLQRPLCRACREHGIDTQQWRVRADRRGRCGQRADQDGGFGVADLDAWQRGVVLESSGTVAGRFWLRDPELHAMQRTSIRASGLLRMSNSATSGHQVELPG